MILCTPMESTSRLSYLNIFQLNKNTAVAVEKAVRIVAYKAG